MSKIVILLFVVLVASVNDAAKTWQRFRAVQNRLMLYFETEKGKFEEEYNTANRTMTENTRKLLESAESTNRKVSEWKRDMWNKAKRDTAEIIVKTLGIAGTEQCYNMYTDIDLSGQDLLSKVNKCTKDMLNTAFENIAETKVMYERLQETLTDWRNRFRICRHLYVDLTKQFTRAALCGEAIETQTKLWLAKSGPQLSAKIDATNNLLSTLLSSDNCASDYYEYELEVPDMILRATACYNQKMNDAAHLLDVA